MRLETKIVQLMTSKTPRVQTLYIDSLKEKNEMKNSWITRHTKLIKNIINLVIILIICFSVQGILNVDSLTDKLVIFLLATIGLELFVNVTIPYLFEIFHKSMFLKNTVLLISYSNIIYLIKSMSFIINLSGILIPIVISTCSFYTFIPPVKIYAILCMTILLIMLFVSLIFKFSLLIDQKKKEVDYLRILGVSELNIEKVRMLEKNIFYVISVVLPMILSFLLIYSGIENHIMELGFAKVMVGEYLICVLLTFFVMNNQYKKIYGVNKNG